MDIFKNLSNKEFMDIFMALYYHKFEIFDYLKKPPRNQYEFTSIGYKWKGTCEEEIEYQKWRKYNEGSAIYTKIFKDTIEDLLQNVDPNKFYQALLLEAQIRGQGLSLRFPVELSKQKEFVISPEFSNWKIALINRPIYIKDIRATNKMGDKILYDETVFFELDEPVREACRILSEKGYLTYWSSSNIEDACGPNECNINRIGLVIKDKKTAFILIDPENLSDELKQLLLLDGTCKFWGVAVNHIDNGKYYGIWAEITSKEMLITDISDELSKKALELPSLEKQDKKVR